MNRGIFSIAIILIISIVYHCDGDKKIASINGNDIKAFRAKYYEEPIDKLDDLNPKSEDVIGIYEKIEDLEKKCFNMLGQVPDNGATCSIQVKFYSNAIIERAKEQIDFCVLKYLIKESRRELNIEQKNCTLDVLESAQKQIEQMSETVENCRWTE